MNLLTLASRNNLGIFREDEGSNVEDILEGRITYRGEIENQPMNGPKRYQPNLGVLTHSCYLFKMEMMVDNNPCKADIEVLELNQ